MVADGSNMTDIILRPASLQDRDAVCALWMDLMKEHEAMEPLFVLAEDASLRWKNDYPAWIEDRTRKFLLAVYQQEIVGFIQAHRHVEPPIYAAAPEVYVDEIYLRPGLRGKGGGRLLLDAVKHWATEIGAVRLRFRVLAVNEDGIRFWEQAGATHLISTYTIPVESGEQQEIKKHIRRIGF